VAGHMLHGLATQRAAGPVLAATTPPVATALAPPQHVVVCRQVTRAAGPCVLVQRF
jgi:hypothetical protein